MARRIKPGIEVPETIDLSSLLMMDETRRSMLSPLTLRLIDLDRDLAPGKAALIGEKKDNLYERIKSAIKNHGLDLRVKTIQINGVKYVYVYKPEVK